MSTKSIPDRAADLIARAREVQASIDALKDAGGSWTFHALLKNDAMSVAGNGMQEAMQLLDRIDTIVRERLDELKGKRK